MMMLKWSNDLLSFRSIFMTGNVNENVTSNIPLLLDTFNYIILIIVIAYTVYYFSTKRKIKRTVFSTRNAIKATIASVLFFIIVQCALQARWVKDMRVSYLTFVERFNDSNAVKTRDLVYKGYSLYVLKNVLQLFQSYKLTEEGKNDINNYLLTHESPAVSKTEFIENHKKNLILIIVESLNAYTINTSVNGIELMPNLKSLSEAEGTVSNLNVIPQVKHGVSCDGQLMANSGLLPIKDGSASMEQGAYTNFISINTILPIRQYKAIFADDGKVWSQKGMFISFGFDEILTSEDYANANMSDDNTMLSVATNDLPTLQEPFFLECTTISMHSPFNVSPELMPQWIAEAGLSDIKKRYYQACNHFDTHLGKFIDKLKESGKWENTVFMVVSDHSVATDEPEGDARYLSNIPMVFIAANTGVTHKFEEPVGQIDIFPTIADIMGVMEDSVGVLNIDGKKILWRGLGNSMFSEKSKGAVDPRGDVHGDLSPEEKARKLKAYEISDMMIRGYYLNELQQQN